MNDCRNVSGQDETDDEEGWSNICYVMIWEESGLFVSFRFSFVWNLLRQSWMCVLVWVYCGFCGCGCGWWMILCCVGWWMKRNRRKRRRGTTIGEIDQWPLPSHHITSHHIPRVRYIRCIVRSAERVFQLSTNDDKKKRDEKDPPPLLHTIDAIFYYPQQWSPNVTSMGVMWCDVVVRTRRVSVVFQGCWTRRQDKTRQDNKREREEIHSHSLFITSRSFLVQKRNSKGVTNVFVCALSIMWWSTTVGTQTSLHRSQWTLLTGHCSLLTTHLSPFVRPSVSFRHHSSVVILDSPHRSPFSFLTHPSVRLFSSSFFPHTTHFISRIVFPVVM